MNRIVKGLVITLVAMLAATSAFALSKTASIAVTANIAPACTITALPLAFGTYDPLGVNKTTALNGQTTVTIQCVDELAATVTLDEGSNKDSATSTPTNPARRMQCLDNDLEFMRYTLYQDTSRTMVWGANGNAMNITADGTPHDYVVYGLIPGGQVLEDGGFADTVVVTVGY